MLRPRPVNIFFLVTAILVALSKFTTAASTINASPEPYTKPQVLIPVDGARRLNLFCIGSGKPTVIFQSGLGNSSLVWWRVQIAVANFTQACSYDRAGYGFSDPANRVSDANSAVDDLHRLLAAAKIPLPVVLVAHSLGGLYSTAYASTYPSDVAGMVLLDPSFAQFRKMTLAIKPARDKFEALEVNIMAHVRRCLDILRTERPIGKDIEQSDCLPRSKGLDDLTAGELRREARSVDNSKTLLSEQRSFRLLGTFGESLDDQEATERPFHFDSKPLIVVTAGQVEKLPQFDEAENAMYHNSWEAGHDALASKSTKGISVVVPSSGHYLQLEQPGTVTGYIKAVVVATRNGTAPDP